MNVSCHEARLQRATNQRRAVAGPAQKLEPIEKVKVRRFGNA